jgi:2-oxoglutarate/2-oxoacid ferredoxin oxidoreductase subunit beta
MCSGCKTVEFKDYYSENVYTWCTNCGNYGITSALKRALVNLQIAPHETLMCFDIGCNGNGSDKINAYTFHGLHGRVIPFCHWSSTRKQKCKCNSFRW